MALCSSSMSIIIYQLTWLNISENYNHHTVLLFFTHLLCNPKSSQQKISLSQSYTSFLFFRLNNVTWFKWIKKRLLPFCSTFLCLKKKKENNSECTLNSVIYSSKIKIRINCKTFSSSAFYTIISFPNTSLFLEAIKLYGHHAWFVDFIFRGKNKN